MAGEVAEHCVLSERVRRLRDRAVGTEPRIACERLRFLRDSYKETEGQPAVLRRGRLLEKVLSEMTIIIDENPIVGKKTEFQMGAAPYPECSCEWMAKESVFRSSLGDIVPSDEDKKRIGEAVDYWNDKCIQARARQVFAEKYAGVVDPDELMDVGVWAYHAIPFGRISVDYGKVLRKGLEGVVAEAEAALGDLPLGSLESLDKRHFLSAAITSCRAVMKFARRYASLARDMARSELDPEKRKELLRIAETCDWVPARPARGFYEAIQSFWFIHLAVTIESDASGISPGRLPMYVYPFFKEDEALGRVARDEALELLELLFINFTELGAKIESGRRFEFAMGSKFQNISLCGVNSLGRDATNDIDLLLLEAQKRVRLFQPTLSILYHDQLSDELLHKAIECVSTGIGMPAFFNNDGNIMGLLEQGGSLQDARNNCIVGCVERAFSHCQNNTWGASLNTAKFLELALNDGRDPLSGRQTGPRTGKAESFSSYEELRQAVRRQLESAIGPIGEFQMMYDALDAQVWPKPFASALVDDCIGNGKDMTQGGSRYSCDGFSIVATIDLANSLAAIRKLVFEDKTISMSQLIQALAADFEGYGQIHRLCLDAPKYGNDESYADSIAKEWYDIVWEEHDTRIGRCHLGRRVKPAGLSVTRHFAFGSKMAALPSGRKARQPLTDGTVSAMPGTDRNGPTALIRSAAKVLDTTKYASNLLNMKFHPSALASKPGRSKLIHLIAAYMSLGGHHVQFNVVGADTLRDAQLNPENHRDLVVRVAGFSAFFVHLSPTVQNEIIRRTELDLA